MGGEALPGTAPPFSEPAIRTPQRGTVLGIQTLEDSALPDLGGRSQIPSLPQLFLFFIGTSLGVYLYSKALWKDPSVVPVPHTPPPPGHIELQVLCASWERNEGCRHSWYAVIIVNTTLYSWG